MVVALGIVLAVSMAGNAWLVGAYLDKRDDATAAANERANAQAAAQACSDATDQLRTNAADQAKAAQAAVAAARAAARSANARADAERNRVQAVPGDACASAEVETREWLQQRRGAK